MYDPQIGITQQAVQAIWNHGRHEQLELQDVLPWHGVYLPTAIWCLSIYGLALALLCVTSSKAPSVRSPRATLSHDDRDYQTPRSVSRAYVGYVISSACTVVSEQY